MRQADLVRPDRGRRRSAGSSRPRASPRSGSLRWAPRSRGPWSSRPRAGSTTCASCRSTDPGTGSSWRRPRIRSCPASTASGSAATPATRGSARSSRPDGLRVVRQLLAVEFGDLENARRGRFSGWFWLSPRDLGLRLRQRLGADPARPGAGVVRAGAREDHQAGSSRCTVAPCGGRRPCARSRRSATPGYHSLIVSYRNDGEAPRSADYRYALGRPRVGATSTRRCGTPASTARPSSC